jgi:hypothetical protein
MSTNRNYDSRLQSNLVGTLTARRPMFGREPNMATDKRSRRTANSEEARISFPLLHMTFVQEIRLQLTNK